MTGHLDPNPDRDYVDRMPDLLLNGCNLSDTLVFLPKLSTGTLAHIFRELVRDRKQFLPKDKFYRAITWHMVTVSSMLESRR